MIFYELIKSQLSGIIIRFASTLYSMWIPGVGHVNFPHRDFLRFCMFLDFQRSFSEESNCEGVIDKETRGSPARVVLQAVSFERVPSVYDSLQAVSSETPAGDSLYAVSSE